jgi:diguanylate cyclase (GGDEF)-like protein/PAS domain S-box-containing protein
VAVAAFGAVAVFASSSELGMWMDDLGTTSAAAIAAGSCLWAASRCPTTRTRRGWALIGLACGSWAAGNALWAVYELALHREVPFPSWADLGYLGFVPLAIAGVALLGPSFASVGTVKRLLDVALITVGLAGLGWIVVLAPVAANTDGLLEQGLSLAYPIADLIMLAVILSVTAVARERNRALSLLLGGLVLFALADVAFAYTTSTGTYASGNLPAWAWFAGFLAIALAARPAEATADVDLYRPAWGAELVTHVPILAVGILLFVQQVVDGRPAPGTVVLIITVGALNALRHLAANRQNARLTLALAEQLAALQEEQDRTHRVIDGARDPYVELDRDGRIMVWNGPAEQVFGWRRDEVVGRLIGEIVPEEMRAASAERIASFVETGDPSVWDDGVDVRYLRPDGREVPIAIAAWQTGTGEAFRIHAFVWDITERVAEQALLEASERRWRSLVQHSSDVTVVLGADGTVINEVPNDKMLLGVEESEFAGRHFDHLLHPDDLEEAAEAFARVVEAPGRSERLRLRLRRLDATYAHVEAIVTNLLEEPTIAGVVCNLRDVTDQVAAENELKRQARRDPLTGLPNRNLMTTALAQQCATDAGHRAALLLMDLDGFKDVNDGLGHDTGDQLLIEIAHRLDRVTRAEDVVARLGGDEFAVLLTRTGGRGHAERVAESLGDLIREPIRLGGVTLQVGVSIGIADCAPGDDPLAVLQRADVAMYRAKREGSGHAVYGSGDDEERRNSVKVAAELRSAIDHGDLVVHYQPKIELATGLVDSVEALVRWQHPVRGLLGPDEFIALAERTGLIRDLTDAVLATALQQCATWRSEGLDLPVAVNLSPRVLGQSDLVASVRRSLDEAGVPAGRLTLEITESAFPENMRLLSATLDELGELGVRLSVDDFGTGWSSLSKLKELPVQELKIDRSFVFALAEDATDHSIVRSILDLARSLSLTVVAEGVETPEVLALLDSLGCPLAQGYLFSRPVPGPLLTGWALEWEQHRQERFRHTPGERSRRS